ncbi:MAG: fused MFS/spermidine synthase [Micromonosporaceae bacterium]
MTGPRAQVRAPVDSGVATLRPDPDRRGGWTLLVDEIPQSYVDTNDPTHLEFEYVRRLASVVDLVADRGVPDGRLRVLHLGGGAMTLPRYVAHTRPDCVQRVVERDAALTALVRRALPLPRGVDLRVRAADARAAVEASAPGRYDLVICDVYGSARMPARLTSTEFLTAVARTLRADGVYAVNVADGPPLTFTRRQVATLRTVFAEVCLIAEPGVLRGRRFGNVVLVAARAGGLPLAELGKAAAADIFPARVVHGPDLARFVAGARPVTDATATDSSSPPRVLFGIR